MKIFAKAQYQHLGGAARENLKVNLKLQKQLNYLSSTRQKQDHCKEVGNLEIDVYQYEERPASPIDIKYLKNVNPK